jgi:predicted ATPase
MRIAISGTHATGKSTLIAELARALPGYSVVEEPYHALLDEGHDFAAPPTIEDFETQLERSCASLAGITDAHVLFDRSPADFLAYLAALADADVLAEWLPPAAAAMSSLDLVVFVPIERPDRIDIPEDEGRRLRKRVDAILREILVDDGWGLDARVLEVRGTPDDRARQVLRHVTGHPGAT